MAQKNLLNNDLLDLKPDIRLLAERESLGKLRKVYRASKRASASLMIGGAFLVLGFIWLLLPVLFLLTSPLRPAPATALIIALPALILLASGGLLAFPRKIYNYWHVSLWQAGFIYEKGQVHQAFRWDQIEKIQGSSVYSPQLGYSILTYRVRRLDGYEVKLNTTFLEIDELIDQVLEEFACQVAAPELRIVPHRRKTFANFKLDRQGVSDTQGTLSWQEMEEIAVEKGVVTVLKRE